jgi:DNA segregation ATPase FtsK/SpoIIIE-like protein
MPSRTNTTTGSGHELTEHTARLLWRWRTELGLLLVGCFVYAELCTALGTVPARVAAIALFAAVVLVPRSRHALRSVLWRARVRRRWERAVPLLGVAMLSDRPPVVRRIERVPAGIRLSLRLRIGTDIGLLERHAESIAVALGARTVRLERDAAHAGTVYLTIVARDPFTTAAPQWPLVAHERTDAWAPIPIGIDEDGTEVWLSLPERNVLLGGEPGAGKSGALAPLVAAAALDSSTEVWLFDGKMVELAPWKPCARRFVGADMDDAIRALDELRTMMDARYRELAATGRRKVAKGWGDRLQVVVIDELALFTSNADRKSSAAFSDRLRDLIARGRAAGIVVLAATQKPSTDVVPSAVRDLFGFRWALRCATREASDTILGSGWATNGYSAAEIDPAVRGVGLLLSEGGIPVRLRTHWLDDDTIAAIARRASAARAGSSLANQATAGWEPPADADASR